MRVFWLTKYPFDVTRQFSNESGHIDFSLFRQIMQSHFLSSRDNIFHFSHNKSFLSQAEKWEPKRSRSARFMSSCSFLSLCHLKICSFEPLTRELCSLLLHKSPSDNFSRYSFPRSFASSFVRLPPKSENFCRRPSSMAFNSRNLFTVCFNFLSCCFTALRNIILSKSQRYWGVDGERESERDSSADVYLYFSFYYLLARSDDSFLHSQQFRVVYSRLSFSLLVIFLFEVLPMMASRWESYKLLCRHQVHLISLTGNLFISLAD